MNNMASFAQLTKKANDRIKRVSTKTLLNDLEDDRLNSEYRQKTRRELNKRGVYAKKQNSTTRQRSTGMGFTLGTPMGSSRSKSRWGW